MSTLMIHGYAQDKLRKFASDSIDCCVTSPPYWGLRDYGIEPSVWADGWRGALGLEPTPQLFIEHMVSIFEQVRRVLKPEGTCWLNIGDSYATQGGSHGGRKDNQRGVGAKAAHDAGRADNGVRTPPPGLKPKDLCLIPFRLAIALQEAGWYVRSDIIWAKPNPMPESVRDRPTKAHEYIFLLTKSAKYYFDSAAVKEPVSPYSTFSKAPKKPSPYATPDRVNDKATIKRLGSGSRGSPDGRNIRSVWTVATQPFPEAHFAVYPEKLIEPCIKAGSPTGGLVLDPFMGAGTTAIVSARLGRSFIGIEPSADYIAMARRRLKKAGV